MENKTDINLILKYFKAAKVHEDVIAQMARRLDAATPEAVKLASDIMFSVLSVVDIDDMERQKKLLKPVRRDAYRVEFRSIHWFIQPDGNSIWQRCPDGSEHTKVTPAQWEENLNAFRERHDALPVNLDICVTAEDHEMAEELAMQKLEDTYAVGDVQFFMVGCDTDVALASESSTDPIAQYKGETRTMHDERLHREFALEEADE